jgi:transcriptional regulator with XRE-family HTH domain
VSRRAKVVARDRRAEAAAYDKAVGARIRARRQSKGMMQDGLAQRIGFSTAQISRYENGETTCEPYALAMIGEALECRAGDFLDAGKPNPVVTLLRAIRKSLKGSLETPGELEAPHSMHDRKLLERIDAYLKEAK